MRTLRFLKPYALQVIPNLKLAAGIVQVYQDSIEFERMLQRN
jgi:preprotein translocase subunit SecB